MSITPEQRLVSNFYENIGNKIQGHLVDVQDGPLVHNFVFEPDKNVKIPDVYKTIQSQDGVTAEFRDKIIFQIPNNTRNKIRFKELIRTKEFKETKATLPVLLGVNTTGKPIIVDLHKVPHLLVTGRTGSGKSVFMNAVIKSLAAKLSPTECKFAIFDTMGCDWGQWNGDKHVLFLSKTEVAPEKLDSLLQLVDERYNVLIANNVVNITEYHKKTHKKDMPFIIVVIDDFADYMCQFKKQTEKFIKNICSKARAVGIHLIIGTQIPEEKVLSKTVKAFMPTRVAFQARSMAHSMLMIGEPGAEKLLPYGDMLFCEAGCYPVRIHTPYVD